ncbi:SRPBCC domain-containing protein [Microbacterium sp.]|uniref:SRPBCC domain-containing protein n=1 Tax=Microbacterium sp. TaxID=51671 RepID=UPI002811B862|nr:SRPBCC domain-containing protein [Microbacterium sp.]
MSKELTELSFTVSGRISRPIADVYEAVADPAQLSKYFTTGGATGRLEPGNDVRWSFDDYPDIDAPVEVVEADPPTRIVVRWDAEAAAGPDGKSTTTFEFESIDDGTRTLVKITESSWKATADGAKNAFGNCEGWTGMLAALKVWVEHGINLREGFYR